MARSSVRRHRPGAPWPRSRERAPQDPRCWAAAFVSATRCENLAASSDGLRVSKSLVLCMQAHPKHRSWASVAIVAGVHNELIIQRELRGKPGKAVIGLEDCFIAGMRQLAVADQDSQSAGIEKGLMHTNDAVDHAGDTPGVVIPSPLLSRNRQTGRDGVVDVGELIRLLVPIGPSGAGEEADILHELLLQIDADAAAALVPANRGDVGGHSGRGSEQNRVLNTSHAAACQEAGERNLARLAE